MVLTLWRGLLLLHLYLGFSQDLQLRRGIAVPRFFFYYIEYAENNRQYPVVFTNDDVMVFDSVVWKNSYLCGDGDKSVDTYQKKRYALLLAET